MLVVQWWRSFAYPGSQAEGKRYHDWDGCIERITQLDSWPDVRTGSSTGMLRARISRPFLVAKADAAGPCCDPRGGSDWPGSPNVRLLYPIAAFRAQGRLCHLSAINRHNQRLFDDLVGAQQNRWGYLKAQRRGGPAVHDHLELGRELHREIARLLAEQNAIHIGGGTTKEVYRVGSVGEQSAVSRIVRLRIDRRYVVSGRRQYDRRAMPGREYIRNDDQ